MSACTTVFLFERVNDVRVSVPAHHPKSNEESMEGIVNGGNPADQGGREAAV